MYDLIIVGAGPAGITAGIYAARKKLNFLMISRDIGGQTAWSGDIENYLGFQFITGPELVKKFKEHLDKFEVELKEGESVKGIGKENDSIRVETDKGEYRSKTVILATGRIPRKLEVKGEAEFKNKGVTYCATCDAPLFADLEVAVVGGGNSGLDAALQLIKIAKKIYLIETLDHLCADPVVVEKVKQNPKVEVYFETQVKEIYGDKFVRGMKVERQGVLEDLQVEGIFVEIGSAPSSEILAGVRKNEKGEVKVDCECKTDLPGIFAAGDVTDVYSKQIIVACGEGAKAALAAFEYLSKKR